MIEKKIEYKIIEFILNRKINLYAFLILVIFTSVFRNNFILSLMFGLPFFIFYELLILLLNYTQKNKYLCYSMIVFIISILIFGIFSTIILNFAFLYFLIFGIRFTYSFSLYSNVNLKERIEAIFCQYMYTPLFIHTQKEKILNLIKERYYKNE